MACPRFHVKSILVGQSGSCLTRGNSPDELEDLMQLRVQVKGPWWKA